MDGIGRLTAGAIAALALGASAGLAQAQSVVGTWNCRGIQEGVAISIQVRYEADGGSVSSFAATGETDGVPMTMEGRGSGRWTLDGDRFAETVDDVRIEALSVDGQVIPPEEIPDSIRQSMLEPSPPATVVQLDDQTLVTEEDDGARLSCTRAG